MTRILLLALGLLIFGCDNSKGTIKNGNKTENADESVDIGSGTEISPQLEGVKDSSTRLEVDTVSSAQEEKARQQK
jgi:hypothetical protein